MKHLIFLLIIALLLSSCQKELADPSGSPSGGGGNGGGGTSNGDLLVRALSITGSDTTVVELTWDNNKRLIQYVSKGKTNGIVTDSKTDIIRGSNGNITKMINRPMGGGASFDSTISYVYYQPGTSKVAYVKNTNYAVGFSFSDSVLITYNTAGKIAVKETYFENFITGTMNRQSKSSYTYDAQGNLLTNTTLIADPLTGVYSPGITITNSYDAHLAPASFGDDAFIVRGLSEESVSHNHLIKKVQTGSGTDITLTMSQFQFNSSDRPTAEVIAFTPVPPGYTLTVTYFYQ